MPNSTYPITILNLFWYSILDLYLSPWWRARIIDMIFFSRWFLFRAVFHESGHLQFFSWKERPRISRSKISMVFLGLTNRNIKKPYFISIQQMQLPNIFGGPMPRAFRRYKSVLNKLKSWLCLERREDFVSGLSSLAMSTHNGHVTALKVRFHLKATKESRK